LTCQGSFVGASLDGGLIKLPPLAYVIDSYLAVELAEEAHSFAAFVEHRPPRELPLDLGDIGMAVLVLDEQRGTALIRRGDEYLVAEPDGALRFMPEMPEMAEGWHRFLLVSEQSLALLFGILERDCILHSSRSRIPRGEIALAAGPSLRLGSISLDFAQNMPRSGWAAPHRFPIFRDGWKHDQISRYDPLMYFVAYGQNAVDQLKICINSLFEIGQYDGKVLIFTDHTEAEIRRGLYDIPTECLIIRNPNLSDWVGYVAGKYMILEEEIAQPCAPVLYMDPDIVFNTDIRPMLADMICLGRPAAPPEYFSKLNENPGVGADLFLADGIRTGDAHGFNAGTIIVPNLVEFGHVFELIRRTAQNYLITYGRDALRWVDQETANYISHQYAHFDLHGLSPRVRWGRWVDTQELGDLSGLVHFWPIRDLDQRVIGMAHYLDRLRAHYGTVGAELLKLVASSEE
jgi:hypothetical protein